MAEDKHCVVAIEPTPLEYWIATTDPRDLAVFEERLKKTPTESQLEVLTSLASKFHAGVVASKEYTV